MNPEQYITILTGVLQGGGLATFFWFLIRGLRSQIKSLNITVSVQQKTLEAMEKQVSETEKIGNIYQKLLHDFPNDIKQYKEFIRLTKDNVIEDQQKAIKKKDKELEELANKRMEEIRAQEKIIEQELPQLRNEFIKNNHTLQLKLKDITSFITHSGSPLTLSKVEDSRKSFLRLFDSYLPLQTSKGKEDNDNGLVDD